MATNMQSKKKKIPYNVDLVKKRLMRSKHGGRSENGKYPFNVALDLTIDLTMLITAAGALIYVTGWSWLLSFMSHFQASTFIIDIPVEFYLIYGSYVFLYAWWLTIPGLLLIFVLLVFPWRVSALLQGLRAFILLLSVIVLFAIMINMAKHVATLEYEKQRKSDFSEYHPRVQVWLKPITGDGSAMADLSPFLSQGCYRLLVQTQKMLFLFAHPPGMQLEPWPVIAMSMDEVIALRGLPQHETPQCLGFSH